jgi:hypothetical protein
MNGEIQTSGGTAYQVLAQKGLAGRGTPTPVTQSRQAATLMVAACLPIAAVGGPLG